VQICLGGIRLRDRLSRLRIGVIDLGQGGLPLLVVHGERKKHYALLRLVGGEVGARDLLELMLRGDHRPRQVYPRRWTRRSISRITRCISSRRIRRITFRSLGLNSIGMILSRSSLILRRFSSRTILSSLSSMMVGFVFRGCRGWCTRSDQTAMQGGLLTSGFYLTLVDM